MAGCIEPVIAPLHAYRRIYPDLPGMGQSPGHPAICCADDMLETVHAFIRQVAGEESYLLAGQSYGGYLSLGLAYKYPRQIRGLYLLCPCTVSDREKRKLPAREIIKREQIRLAPGESREAYDEFLAYTAVATQETWERYKANVLPGLACGDAAFQACYQQHG